MQQKNCQIVDDLRSSSTFYRKTKNIHKLCQLEIKSNTDLKGNPSEVSQKRTLTDPLFAQALQIFKHYKHFKKVLPDFVS